MPRAVILTDEDAVVLEKLISFAKNNPRILNRSEQPEDGDQTLNTTSYVVYIPVSGILGASFSTGTGTGTSDVPGTLECTVYKPVSLGNGLFDYENAEFSVLVANPYGSDLVGGRFAVVVKDQYEDLWYVTQGAGSATLNQASEVLVVRVPTGGIDGLNTNTTTGTSPLGDLDDDLIDYAECEVFELLFPCQFGSRFESKGFTVCVHNLGYCHIEGGRFIRAVKDAYGVWWADEPACDFPTPTQPPPWTGTGTGTGVPMVSSSCGVYPETMYISIEIPGCGGSFVVPVVWDGVNSWFGNVIIGSGCCPDAPTEPLQIALECLGGSSWQIVASAPTQGVPDAVSTVDSTDPLQVTMTGTYYCNATMNAVTMVATETSP